MFKLYHEIKSKMIYCNRGWIDNLHFVFILIVEIKRTQLKVNSNQFNRLRDLILFNSIETFSLQFLSQVYSSRSLNN